MRKFVFTSGVIALCSFVMSVVFKVLSLMGAQILLLVSAISTCLFIGSFAIYKFKPNEKTSISKWIDIDIFKF